MQAKQNNNEMSYIHSLFHVIMSQTWINCKWKSKPDEWRVTLINTTTRFNSDFYDKEHIVTAGLDNSHLDRVARRGLVRHGTIERIEY